MPSMDDPQRRRCSRCQADLPLDAFPLRRKDGTQRYTHCRDCKAAYQRQWYERNGDRHRSNIAAKRIEQRRINKVMVVAAKSRPCTDCGVRYPPYVMDLDHVRGTKVRNVALLKTYATTAILRAEIAKCEVVCANCHRIRSHRRREGEEPAV